MALFWGGSPSGRRTSPNDPEFIAIHLPLVNFFRLRLPYAIQHRVIHGATLLSLAPDEGDFYAFNRWSAYMRSGDEARGSSTPSTSCCCGSSAYRSKSFSLIDSCRARDWRNRRAVPTRRLQPRPAICDFITDNFRQDIDCADIAVAPTFIRSTR